MTAKIGEREQRLREMREERARRMRPLPRVQVQKAADRAVVSAAKAEKKVDRGKKGRR